MSYASFRGNLTNCTSIRGKVVSYASYHCSFLKCASLRREAKKSASFRKERRYCPILLRYTLALAPISCSLYLYTR